ncbi:MAG: hypothetical protein EOP09_16835 [Proteobacteria bacterium]|nr:MAG: hypothetical protein EOP09_16835 [Pseudomonadota bacterium]
MEESLTSPKWHPVKPVIAGYGGVWVRLKETRKEMIGKRAIFITNMHHLQHWGPIFVPTYGYFLTEPVEKKAEIQKLLKISSEDNESWSQFDQMAQYIRDSESITKGTTREKVEKLLHHVGRSSETKDKYAFNRSPYVTLDIEFTRINGRDTVVSVSKPYIDWPK